MTETATKIRTTVNWSTPVVPPTRGGIDWGTHVPNVSVEADPPAEGEVPSGVVAGQLMAEIYGEFLRGDLVPWRWLTSPDEGPASMSFSRPDLIPALQLIRTLIGEVKEELLRGPRRTVWNPERGAFQIIAPSAIEEGQARKEGRLS